MKQKFKKLICCLCVTSILMPSAVNVFAENDYEISNEIDAAIEDFTADDNVSTENAVDVDTNDDNNYEVNVDEVSDSEISLLSTGTYYSEYGIYFDSSTGTITDADESLTSLAIPDEIDGVAVTKIGNSAFSGCTKLAELNLGTGITTIGSQAFMNCSSLTSVTFPASLTSLANRSNSWYNYGVFYGCSKLETVIFNNSAATIGEYTFYGCSAIKSVSFGNAIKSIGRYAFYGCNGLTTVSIPASTTGIGEHAFQSCSNLENVYVGSGATSIGTDAFANCPKLASIDVDSTNSKYKSSDGILFNKTGTTLIKYPPALTNTSYTVPEGVTTISSNAFASAKNLNTINLPASLETIGNSAFSNCISLKNVNMPRVLTIGDSAFSGCTSIDEILIPQSTTSVGSSAFSSCTALKKVVFNDSAAKIGNSAFYGCTKLAELNLGTGITTIGSQAFMNCSSLTSVTFPASLTSLANRSNSWYNYGVFYGCSKLETVIFNNSAATIGEYTFYGCSAIKSVSFGNAIKSIGRYAFYGCNGLTTVSIPQTIKTVDSNAFSYCRNLHTIYGYTGTAAETYANNNGIKFVSLGGTYTGTYKTNTTVIMQRNGKVYDLLTERQVFGKGSKETVTIIVNPDWQGKPEGRILLSQGGLNYIESSTGLFENICPADLFNSDGNICVILVTGDGGTVDFQPIQLQITSTPEGSQATGSLELREIKLFDDFSITIPDTIPILSGGKYGISMGSISTDIEIDDNEFKITLGSTILEGKKGSDGKWKKEDWEGLKSGFNDSKEKLKQGISEYDFLKNIASPKTHLELKNGVGGEVTAVGYLEGCIDENGQMKIFEGGVIIAGKIKYSYQGMTVVGVVPLYYEIGAGGELKFVGGIKGYIPNEGIQAAFTGSITPSVFFEAGGGIGIPYVMTAGVKGKIKVALEVALERVYQKFTVEGSANFQWKGPFNVVLYEKDFAKGTWYIYETGNPDTLLGSTMNMYSLSGVYNNIDLNSPVQLENRDYILTPSEWTGGIESDIAPFSVDYTNSQLSVLEKNTYKDAAPIIADMQGTKVMAWITDNGGRDAVNKSMLVYSVYNEQNKLWSVPTPLANDGAPDFYPEMKDGYIVWQKANTTFTDKSSINDMSRSSEIYVAKWNGSSFDEPIRVTENDAIDTKPTLAVKNDIAYITWITNTENNFMGTAGTNSILTCSFDGSNLSEQTTVASELTAITNMSASYTDKLNVYYVTDTDNDYATVTDRDIYSVSGTETTQITSNSTLDSNPITVDVNGEEWLFWYSDGNIMYKTSTDTFAVFDDVQSGITDDFNVISNGESIVITWTSVNDGGAEIQGVFYDGKCWSKDIQISAIGENVKYPHGIMDENGVITLAFNRTQKIATDDYYTDGQADLCTLQVTPSYDIAINSATISGYELTEGENTLLVDVANNGELSVSSYKVEISDENGNKLGEYISDEQLLAGDEKMLEIVVNIGEKFTAQNIIATISAGDIDEYNVDNNSLTLKVGEADAKILNTAIGENKVSVSVKNAGFETVNNINVSLKSEASNIALSKKVASIMPKAAATVEFDVDLSKLHYEDGYSKLLVNLESDNDNNISNNEKTINISEKILNNCYEISLYSASNTPTGSIINASIKNNLQYDKNASVIAAIYEGDKLISVKMEDKKLVADNYTTVDFNFEGVTLDKSYKIKLFIWEDSKNLSPIGIAKEYMCSDYIK